MELTFRPQEILVSETNPVASLFFTPDLAYAPQIITSLISQVTENDEDFLWYSISVPSICPSLSDMDWNEIKRSLDSIISKNINIIDTDNRKNSVQAISEFEIDRDTLLIRIRIQPVIKKFFVEIKNKIKNEYLADFFRIRSVYSKNIFSILISIDSFDNCYEIPVKTIHECLNTPKSFRSVFTYFKNRVINQAISDIHEKTPLRFICEYISDGKNVTSIRFSLTTSNDTASIVPPTKKYKTHKKIINDNTSNDIQQEGINDYTNEFPCDDIENRINEQKNMTEIEKEKMIFSSNKDMINAIISEFNNNNDYSISQNNTNQINNINNETVKIPLSFKEQIDILNCFTENGQECTKIDCKSPKCLYCKEKNNIK